MFRHRTRDRIKNRYKYRFLMNQLLIIVKSTGVNVINMKQ